MYTKISSVSKKLAAGAIGMIFAFSISAQDIHFSQLFENPLSLNPALCGAFAGSFYAEANYKNQWNSVAQNGNGYTTTAATIEFHNMLKGWGNGYLSPGFTVFQDESGDAHLTQLEFAFTLASGIYLDDNNCLSVGLQAGYSQSSITLTGLQWDDQYSNGLYNSNLPSGENLGNSFTYGDFSGGIAYHYGNGQTNMSSNDGIKASVGAAIYHVNEPTMSFLSEAGGAGTELYMKYTGYANMEVGVPNSNLRVLPAIVYLQQGPAWELDAGTKLRYVLSNESVYTGTNKGTALDLGVYYRVGDALIALVGLEHSNYAFAVSYDFNTSALTTASHGAGGFELSLRFINPFAVAGGANATRSVF